MDKAQKHSSIKVKVICLELLVHIHIRFSFETVLDKNEQLSWEYRKM
jgi:hypothetical protein